MPTHHRISYPSGSLSHFIKCYLDIQMGDPKHAVDFNLPAKMEQCIFVSTGPRPYITNGSNDISILSGSGLCNVRGSVKDASLRLKMAGVLSMFVIIFKPGMFSKFFNLPAIEFSNTFTAASISIGKQWEDMAELINDCPSFEGGVQIAEDFLFRQLSFSSFHDDQISNIVSLVAGKSICSVEEMSRKCFLSERQFLRRFSDQTGLSPQNFLRIHRTNEALRYKQRIPERSWRSISQEFGYADQSHFNKEVKSLLGVKESLRSMDNNFLNVQGTNFRLLESGG